MVHGCEADDRLLADALSAGCGSPHNDATVEGTGDGALSARCESPQTDDGLGRIRESSHANFGFACMIDTSADATFEPMMRLPGDWFFLAACRPSADMFLYLPPRARLAAGSIIVSVDRRGRVQY